MASFYIYDINTYLKTDSRLLSISGKSALNIMPAVGYEEDTAPVILWWYSPNIRNPELPWWRTDKINYYILDQDADRCIAMGERIISLLNLSDGIRTAVASPSYHGKWVYLCSGSFDGPAEKEGWYRYRLEFDVSYLPT
jgi:hypothetical protein